MSRFSSRDLFRFKILAQDGKVGKAEDLYFEDPTWAIRYLVVNTGRWLPTQRVLIQPECLGQPDPVHHVVPVSMTKEEVTGSAGSETEQPISHQQQQLLHQRYGGNLYAQGGGPMGAVHGVVEGQALAMARAEQSPEEESQVEPKAQLRSVREGIGYLVEAVDGPTGCVEDFLLEDAHWLISYIVVNTKDVRLPNPKVLVPTSWVQDMCWSESRVHLRVHRDKVKQSQRYDPTSHALLHKPPS